MQPASKSEAAHANHGHPIAHLPVSLLKAWPFSMPKAITMASETANLAVISAIVLATCDDAVVGVWRPGKVAVGVDTKHNSILFSFFCKKIIELPEGQINDP